MGELKILTTEGDETLAWDPDDAEQVKTAKKEWDRLKGEGYEFYVVEEAKGKKLSRFDKKLGRVIAAPGGRTAKDKEAGTRGRAMAGGPKALTEAGSW
jgi:hypothetical protein